MIRLSQKEEEVMEHIWQLGECTPRDVLMRYPEPQPLLNGIQNVFQSLERKGYLDHRREGRGYVYWPVVEKKDYGRSRLRSFVDRYLDGSIKELVSFFAKEQKLSAEELREVIEEIEQTKDRDPQDPPPALPQREGVVTFRELMVGSINSF